MKFGDKLFCSLCIAGVTMSAPGLLSAQNPQGMAGQAGQAAQNTATQAGQDAQHTASQAAQTANDQTMDRGSQKMANSPDVAFAMKAAQGGMAEVQMGQLASQKGQRQAVKDFGQMMVQDHTKANDQLKSIAQQENMTLPTTLSAKDQALYNKLQTMSGTDFDKHYAKAMVKDHEEDIKEFKKESNNGKNEQLKSFATSTLPVLQTHLEKAKDMEKAVDKGGGSNSTM